MKWIGRRESDNVEDRRGMSGGQMAIGGGIVGIIALVYALLTGGDPSQVMNELQNQNSYEQTTNTTEIQNDSMAKFVKVVLADNEDVWHKVFTENGMEYIEPKLVLFRGSVQSGCGGASASVGPFYCPTDQKIYMDLNFFDELKNRFGAKGGDFAIAYVIAHEVGHHVQNLLGTSDKVHSLQQRVSERKANKLSVALELQADFYAGLWTYHTQQMKLALEEGDIEEALSAANAVGDDHLQKITTGQVVPDAFTHGTSAQRMEWFKRGLARGSMKDGNTFDEIN